MSHSDAAASAVVTPFPSQTARASDIRPARDRRAEATFAVGGESPRAELARAAAETFDLAHRASASIALRDRLGASHPDDAAFGLALVEICARIAALRLADPQAPVARPTAALKAIETAARPCRQTGPRSLRDALSRLTRALAALRVDPARAANAPGGDR